MKPTFWTSWGVEEAFDTSGGIVEACDTSLRRMLRSFVMPDSNELRSLVTTCGDGLLVAAASRNNILWNRKASKSRLLSISIQYRPIPSERHSIYSCPGKTGRSWGVQTPSELTR